MQCGHHGCRNLGEQCDLHAMPEQTQEGSVLEGWCRTGKIVLPDADFACQHRRDDAQLLWSEPRLSATSIKQPSDFWMTWQPLKQKAPLPGAH